MLNTKIKASKVSNLTDARYFAAWMIDWMGFCLDEASENQVSPELLHALRDWVEGPLIVGEFGEQEPAHIHEAVSFLNLDVVQVGAFYDEKRLQELGGISIIKEVQLHEDWNVLVEQCKAYTPHVQYLLLEGNKNNITWSDIKNNEVAIQALKHICNNQSTILSLNVKGNEAEKILSLLKPEGFNVFGGAEEKTGFKSFDELDDLFEQLED